MLGIFFLFKQKTAYEMRISDWSSDVCSSYLPSLESCYMIEDCSEDIPYPHKEETPQKNKIEAAERIRIRRTGHRSHSDNCPAPPRFESEESSNKNTWRIAALPAGVAATARDS